MYPEVLLPKYYLESLFPWIFRAFWATNNFQIGILLPLAVLTCFGLDQLLKAVPGRMRSRTVFLVLVIVCFEYYQRPTLILKEEDGKLDFIDWLATEETQESIHLINLPMSRVHSKYYGFYQTLNGYPHVEGLASRTPSEAYAYINGNFLLDSWRRFRSVHCLPSNQPRVQQRA